MGFNTELAIYQYRLRMEQRFAEWVAAGCPARFVVKESPMGKKAAVDDLSDILGDEPSTTKEKSMGKQDKAAAAAAAVKASANKAKPAKVAAPAKVAKPAVKAVAKPAKKASKGGEGKFHFPVGTPEREALKKRVLAAVTKAKSISTKDLGKQLGVETFKVRLVSVELADEKAIKREKDGNAFTLKAK